MTVGVERHVYPWTIVSVSEDYNKPTIDLVQSEPHHHLIKIQLILTTIRLI
jgi:hypothetical protein